MTQKDKVVFSWCMYDWANSAFATTVLAAVLPVYFASLVPEGGVTFHLSGLAFTASGTGLWGYAVSSSLLVTALCAPVLGALADHTRSKKKFLLAFTVLGSVCSCLFYLVGERDWLLCLLLFVCANIGFAGGMPFYDGFLPEIASAEEIDWVSGKGYAYGYAGGGILLALHFVLIAFHGSFGIPERSISIRISLGSVGLWWAVFAVPLFLWVPEVGKDRKPPPRFSYVRYGFTRFVRTVKSFRSYRDLLWFLVAFLVYNDGIQTVIAMAAIFGKTALGLDTTTLIGTLLMIQFIALPGALVFAKLARRIQAKKAIVVTLALWTGLVTYAYFITTPLEFWILGGAVGLILGGSQALSRSLYGQLIPRDRPAEFYGFFTISAKFASVLGPLSFGLVSDLSTSPRNAILSILVFFAAGLMLLSRVDVDRGLRVAKEDALEKEANMARSPL
jgi:UMF1 family MFS transporter